MCVITRLFWLSVLLPVLLPEAEKHVGRVIERKLVILFFLFDVLCLSLQSHLDKGLYQA